MIAVNSWDELLSLGADSVLGKIKPDELVLEKGLILTVRVWGESWNGYIDYRGANYVLELQAAVNRLYRELADTEQPLRDLQKYIKVKVRVIEGSTRFEINLNEVWKMIVEKLSKKEIALIVTFGILSFTGYHTTDRVLDYKYKLQADAIHAEQNKALLPLVDKALDIIQKADLEKPSRVIINKLNPGDSIALADGEEMSPGTAKQRFPQKPKIPTERGIFDDTYTILNIDFDKIPPVFTILKDGLRFSASAELPDAAIDKLAEELKLTMRTGVQFTVPLNVFVVYNKRGIKSASIQGVGEKREGCKDIQDIIQML